jgi:hypothetical protein
MGNPGVDIIYTHKKNDNVHCSDTRKIKKQIKGKPINSPDGMRMLREDLKRDP